MDKITDAVKEVANEMVERYEFIDDVYVLYTDKDESEYLVDSFYKINSNIIPQKTLRIFFTVSKESVKKSETTPQGASSFYRRLATHVLNNIKDGIDRYQKIINRRPAGLV